jgi:ribosomal protein S12 methylthiotransferase accessory factor
MRMVNDMRLTTTYLNERVEVLDGLYDEKRAAELAAVSRLYNCTIGPITALNLVRPEDRDLSMYSAYSHHIPVERLIRDLRFKPGPYGGLVPGGGKGATMLRPLLGALGEMTERLLAILHFTSLQERVRYGSYLELARAGYQGLAPDEVPLFAAAQYAAPGFEFAPFEEDTWLGWVEGSDLLTGEPVWVPAQLVLMYYKPHPDERMIGYATTAGLAFQTARLRAILHGLFEVIERDALNIRWYSRLPPARIIVDLKRVLAAELGVPQSRMKTPDLDVDVFLLTLDSPIPVVATIGIDRSRVDRAFLGGTGASSRREDALAQALFELGQCQTGFHFEDPFGRLPIDADTDLADVVEFFDAPLYYGHERNIAKTAWFTANDHCVEWEVLPTSGADTEEAVYERMRQWLREGALRAVVLDFGDVCPPGMAITKVFVPGLTHACPPRNPMLGHPRFTELPYRLGLSGHPLVFEDLHTDPAPFA